MKIRRWLVTGIIRTILLLWSVMVIYPLVWMFLSAFRTTTELYTTPWALPSAYLPDNFIIAWDRYNLGRSFFNTLYITALACAVNLFLSIPTAYAIARIRFGLNQKLLNLYLAAMMIPSVLGWIPLYFLISRLGLLNQMWVVAIIYAAQKIPFSVYILYSFLGGIPRELEESASIDGMSQYGILFRLITPLLRSGVITVTVINIIAFWGEYFLSMLFLQEPSHQTLAVALDLMNRNATFQNAWGALFAGIVITTVPVMLIYALLQKHIVKGIVDGALKG